MSDFEDAGSNLSYATSYVDVKHESAEEQYTNPCPCVERVFGTTIIYQCCCCCFWSTVDRQNCAIGILYGKLYLLIYLIIISITITLLSYDFANDFSDLRKEPTWFVALDITCVTLMVFDVTIQIQAHPLTYWKSPMNIFDFIVVALCVIAIPIYFYVPASELILTIVLLFRFAAQLLRIVMIYKHQQNRSAYIDATKNQIVDFSKFDDSVNIEKNLGLAEDGNIYQPPKMHFTDIDHRKPNEKINNIIKNESPLSAHPIKDNYYPDLSYNKNKDSNILTPNSTHSQDSLAQAIHQQATSGYDSMSDAAEQHSMQSQNNNNNINNDNKNNKNNNDKNEIQDDNQQNGHNDLYNDNIHDDDDGFSPVVT